MNQLLVDEILRQALLEDLGHGDITTALMPQAQRVVSAYFLAKQDGVLAGLGVAARCFSLLDPVCATELKCADGAQIKHGDVLGTVRGPAAALLGAERVALNFVQRLSGIATLTHTFARQAQPAGIRISETRKTTPLLRTLEKYAVRVGGGHNHRLDLDHCVMLKDNHFALWGGEPGALVRQIKAGVSHTMKVIAEAGDPGMVAALLDAGADVILLDNFTPEQVRSAVAEIAGRTVVEVSGGVNAANLADYLIPGVDVISIGALTHSVKSLDISLELELGG
jgi:nicotinate-nucleotide pyrophosphorylase (carboxylating)